MAWYDEQGLKIAESTGDKPGVAVIDSGKNLTLKHARHENTGKYQCVATVTVDEAKPITIVNVLRVNGQLQYQLNIQIIIIYKCSE